MSSALKVSIGTNILLAGALAVLLVKRAPIVNAVSVVPTVSKQELPTAAPIAIIEVPGLKRSQPKLTGTRLDAAAVSQLEQMGVSREILINVLLEDFSRRSSKRVLALQKKYAPRLLPDREIRELTRQSEAEQIREFKAAFGEEGYRAWDKEQTLHALNRARLPGDELPMSPQEAEQAYRLQKEFDEKGKELQALMEDGVADKADVGSLQAQAQRTLDKALEQLLGSQRFNELKGNSDPSTEVYRTFGDLNPTPDQAKAVAFAESEYRARESALAKRAAESPANAANVAAELKALNAIREENLRRVFGADAYEDFKRQNDATYQTLKQYATAWDLKDVEVQSVYESLNAFHDQADRTRMAAEMSEAAGQHVNWREINAAIEQARQQTEAGLQNTIGAERLQRLKQNGVLTIR